MLAFSKVILNSVNVTGLMHIHGCVIKVKEVCVCVRDLHGTRSDVLDLAAW